MNIDKEREDLWNDFLNLGKKYSDSMPIHEFGYALIQFSARMLMDTAPSYAVALDTIKAGVESGINWHVEEKLQLEKEVIHE